MKTEHFYKLINKKILVKMDWLHGLKHEGMSEEEGLSWNDYIADILLVLSSH